MPFCLPRGRDKQAHLNKKEEIENVYLMKERKEETVKTPEAQKHVRPNVSPTCRNQSNEREEKLTGNHLNTKI